MRNLKRVLSLALAAMMLIGMMVVGASAVDLDFTDTDEIKNTEAVEVMVALNVFNGVEDGSTFDPAGTLTREQMSKIIAYVMNGGVEPVLGVKDVPTYSDIDDTWAEKYIEYASSMGIIAGDGTGKFNPKDTLTGEQAAKMLLTAMGYNAEVFGFTGNGWDVNVNRYANEAGLYEDLGGLDPSAPISRDDACQLVYNAIQAWMVERSWSQNQTTGEITEGYAVSDTKTLLNQKFGAEVFIGTFDGNYNTGDASKGEIQITGNLTTDDIVPTSPTYVAPKAADFPYDLDIKYIGEEFKVIYKEGSNGANGRPDKNDTIYGVFNTGDTTVYTITKGDLQDAGATNTAKGKIKFNDTLYDVAALAAADVAIVTNYGDVADVTGNTIAGGACTAAQFAAYINTAANGLRVKSADTIKFVCNDQGEIYRAYVEQWTYSSVLSETSTKIQLEGIGSRDVEDVNYIDDVEVGDLVAVADFYGNVQQTQVKTAESVTGTVDAISGTKIQIDGTWYDVSANAETLSDYGALTYVVGDEYEIVLDGSYYVAGKVITATVDYAVVLKASQGINDQVKLLLADGTEATYIINSDSTLKYGDINAAAGTATAALVKYELLKNGTEVKMTLADSVTDAATAETHSFDKETKVLTVYNGAAASNYVATSDAVAFVYNTTTNKWKAFSANNTSDITAGDQTVASYALKSGKAAAFALVAAAFPAGSGDGTGYGYVTDVVYTKLNDDNVVNVTVWNGTESYTIVVDGSTAPAAVGDFVKYPISSVAVASGEVVKANTGNFTFGSVKVKEYDTDRSLVITTTGTYSVSGSIVGDVESVYKVDSNTQIIGVKTADKKGSDYNAISVFTKVSGQDFNNAYIIAENDNGTMVIKAIFVDEDNAITTYPGGTATKAGAAGAPSNVTAAVVTAGTAAAPVNGAYITVTTDKTQIIAGETVTYTVTINGDVTAASKITMTPGANAAAGASVTITGDTTNVTEISGTEVNIAANEGNGTVITFTVTGNGAVASSFALANQ